ncbi:MAG: glutamate--tRNA ligase [Pseudomonadota bacterium]
MPPIKTRFAPSPTGLIHLGNARTALLSALGGDVFVLRIEDTDLERSRAEFVAELIADLRWLGLDWQEGPRSAEPDPHWFQSRRGEVYRDYYHALEEQGLAYPCFCTQLELEVSRKVQLSAGRPPRYSGKCAHLSADEIRRKREEGLPATLRFRVPKNQAVEFEDEVRGPQRFAGEDIGDFIIRRADGSPAFFFCNAIDDALMGITRVLRGEDHLANTPRQLMILAALDLPAPRYAHISLIVGDDGAPLSKRNGSRSIKLLREEGYFPEAVVNMLARLGHHYDSEELLGLAELRAGFDVDRLGRSPARFDLSHLDHWQHLAVRGASDEALWAWLHTETRAIVSEAHRLDFLDIVRSNCLFPRQADAWARILFTDELELDADIAAMAQSAGEAFYLAAIDAATESPDDFSGFLAGLKRRSGVKGKHLFLPLRAALTGSLDGPELAKIYRLLDKPRLHRRLAEFTYESE